MNAVCFLDKPTRAAIASYAGISMISAAAVLERLCGEGVVKAAGTVQGRGGRPSVLYALNEAIGRIVGISISEGLSRIASMDMAGNVIDRKEFSITLTEDPSGHVAEIISQTAKELKGFINRKTSGHSKIMALCVALPGMVDSKEGVWLHGLQVSGIEHIPFCALLEEKLGVPVAIEDKSRCLAFFEHSKQENIEVHDSAFLYLGEGIGAGLVFGGSLYYGARGLAGEIGHLTVDPGGSRCACGNIGCLETVLSGPGIIKRFRKRLDEGVTSSLQLIDSDMLDLGNILEAAGNNDRLAMNMLFETGSYVGDACATIIQMFNPDRLTVGGPVSMLCEFFKDAAMLRIRQRVMPEMVSATKIDFVVSGEWDETIGACRIARASVLRRMDVLLEDIG